MPREASSDLDPHPGCAIRPGRVKMKSLCRNPSHRHAMSAPMPVFGERALHLPEDDVLVVGDLHVGLETDLRRRGVNIPSQTHVMRDRLLRLLESTLATRIVVIGDLKHRIPFSTRQEVRELPELLRGLPAKVELVRGNHDVDMEDYLPIEVHPAEGIRIGDVGLSHGHVWPSDDVMRASTIVTCHNHPAVQLVDALGHRHKEPCWVRAAFTPAARARYLDLAEDARLLVMPAFNSFTGGTAFNAEEGQRLLGPLFGNGFVDVDEARIYTLDGVDLGKLRSLRPYGDAKKGPRRRGPRNAKKT